MIEMPNGDLGKNAMMQTLVEKIRLESPPPITVGAAGFPAEMLDQLHTKGGQFDARTAVALAKAGADLFAPLPMVRFSTYDPSREIGKREATRLSSPTMFSALMFRPNVTNKVGLRKLLPCNLPAFPKAGLFSIFDEQGNPVVHDQELSMLEYAALTTNDQRIYDLLLSSVNTSVPEVRECMNRALDVFVTGGGLGKPQPIDDLIQQRARNLVSLVLAGADPSALQSRTEDEHQNPRVRMLQLLFKALSIAKQHPRHGTSLQTADFGRIETAIEHITRPDPVTGALPFDVDYRNPETGRTFLHYAVEYAGPRTVEALLTAGADVDAELDGKRFSPNAAGSITPLSIAEEAGEDEIVVMLHAWKAKMAVADAIGRVARHRNPGDLS